MRKNPWEIFSGRSQESDNRFFDFHGDQQIEHTHIEEEQTMTSRIIMDVAMTIFFFFVFWLVFSIFQMFGFIINGGQLGMQNFGDSEGLVISFGHFMRPTVGKVILDIAFSAVFYVVMYIILKHNLDSQNVAASLSDINNYTHDSRIQFPGEVQRNFDWFPDVGCTSDVQVSSMISHVAVSNRGLKMVHVARRAKEDILDENGEVAVYKGDVLTDENGQILFDEMPLIDTEFMHALYDASGMIKSKTHRKFYNTQLIPYNPDGSKREKLGKFATVADLINKDWEFPYYEPQRPAGAYLVDTAPVNTMVLAIGRYMAYSMRSYIFGRPQ